MQAERRTATSLAIVKGLSNWSSSRCFGSSTHITFIAVPIHFLMDEFVDDETNHSIIFSSHLYAQKYRLSMIKHWSNLSQSTLETGWIEVAAAILHHPSKVFHPSIWGGLPPTSDVWLGHFDGHGEIQTNVIWSHHEEGSADGAVKRSVHWEGKLTKNINWNIKRY